MEKYSNQTTNRFFIEQQINGYFFTTFNQNELVAATTDDFFAALSDKIMLHEISKITINETETGAMFIYLLTKYGTIIEAYISANKTDYNIKCINSSTLQALDITLN